MLLSFSRRFLALLLALGVLSFTPVSAYDSDYDEEEQEVKKSKKKKSKKKKQKSDDDDYWDEDSWDDDEVEPVVKKKKKKKKKSKKKKSKKKKSEEEDSWDDWDSWDEDDGSSRSRKNSSDDDEEDFFADDDEDPEPVKQTKTAMGSTAKPADTPREPERPKAVARPKPAAQPAPAQPRAADPGEARRTCVRKLIAGSPDIEFVDFKVVHSGWQGTVRVNKEHRVLVHMNHWHDVATVLELTERELRVKWDNWGVERFLRQADNSYMLESMVKRSDSALSRKASRTAKRLRSSKAIPWSEYGWFAWLKDYITGKKHPLTYKTFHLVNENMECEVRFSEEEKVLVKMDESHEPAAVLGYTGVKLHLRWESGAVETYRRLEDGSYRRIDDERVARQLLDPNISSREKSEDDWFQIWWRDIMNEEKPLTYVNLELKKGNVEYRPRLSMDNLVLIQLPPHKGWAKVIKFDRRRLIIRWNGETEELYERDDENVYHFVK